MYNTKTMPRYTEVFAKLFSKSADTAGTRLQAYGLPPTAQNQLNKKSDTSFLAFALVMCPLFL